MSVMFGWLLTTAKHGSKSRYLARISPFHLFLLSIRVPLLQIVQKPPNLLHTLLMHIWISPLKP